MKVVYFLVYLAFAALFVSATRSLLRYSHDLEVQNTEVHKFWLVWLPKGQSSLKFAINFLLIFFTAITFVLAVNIVWKFLEILAYMI